MSVADYMRLCLTHPDWGYYIRRDGIGQNGDFTTAAEISQMFGEMIGAWCGHMWTALGSPAPFNLVELGPGHGTLSADLLRAATRQPGFIPACRLHLVETSPVMRSWQKQSMAAHEEKITWHESFDTVPHGPLIVIANEFFDALPIRQYIRRANGWHERLVASRMNKLIWDEGQTDCTNAIPVILQQAVMGAIFERSPERESLAEMIAAHITRNAGAALIIDYGFQGPELGDSLQAVARHRYVDPLASPGIADLTSHVDFSALAHAAERRGAKSHGPITQGKFLNDLGIGIRATALRRARPDKAEDIDTSLSRLTAPGQMGELFKVMALTAPEAPPPPPFR